MPVYGACVSVYLGLTIFYVSVPVCVCVRVDMCVISTYVVNIDCMDPHLTSEILYKYW